MRRCEIGLLHGSEYRVPLSHQHERGGEPSTSGGLVVGSPGDPCSIAVIAMQINGTIAEHRMNDTIPKALDAVEPRRVTLGFHRSHVSEASGQDHAGDILSHGSIHESLRP